MTRTPLIVMAALAAALIAGAVVADALKGPPTANQGTRAVIVSTADRSRGVVVPPCNTGVEITPANAPRQATTFGATVVAFPQAPGMRVVLVPRCSQTAGVGSSGTINLPSAAFVLRVGSRIAAGKGSKGPSPSANNVHSQVIIPPGSAARSVVVPPCRPQSGSGKGNAVVVTPPPAGSSTALAPRC
ncbi:MAG TPA: hypothetical protein VKA96_10065 [Solirubrobacteraceae bacterium]|nr:hypothetical protein [Solirubrobacteraceae bacterium]